MHFVFSRAAYWPMTELVQSRSHGYHFAPITAFVIAHSMPCFSVVCHSCSVPHRERIVEKCFPPTTPFQGMWEWLI